MPVGQLPIHAAPAITGLRECRELDPRPPSRERSTRWCTLVAMRAIAGRPTLVLGLAMFAGLAYASAGVTATVTYPAYDHARVVGLVTHAKGEVALTFDDCNS